MMEVLEVAGMVTIQDSGRPGFAHLGVPRSGWADPPAARLANRLVGNAEGAALLEIGAGALRLRFVSSSGTWIAATGAVASVRVDGRAVSWGAAQWVPGGAEVEIGPPISGLRVCLAVAGGVAVEPVLGSRSTDTLAWVGPPRVAVGQLLPIGTAASVPPHPDGVVVPRPVDDVWLRVTPGPREDWFAEHAPQVLRSAEYLVGTSSDRIGIRLDGPTLERARTDELPSEGLVLGAIQVPPSGAPVVFLADHPVTGGYPVIAVVHPDDVALCAQLRPGARLRFRSA